MSEAELTVLLAKAREHEMDDRERSAQRESFAYGNLKAEPDIRVCRTAIQALARNK